MDKNVSKDGYYAPNFKMVRVSRAHDPDRDIIAVKTLGIGNGVPGGPYAYIIPMKHDSCTTIELLEEEYSHNLDVNRGAVILTRPHCIKT